MESTTLVDTAGRRRSPAIMPGYDQGRPPRNKGLRYPADPPTVEEIIAVMLAAGDDADAVRFRGLIVVLWRAGLRISEALALAESDLDSGRGAILVRHGKGGKRREVGMDRWAWEQLDPWLALRSTLPVGALFCVLGGPTRGRPWSAAGVRAQLRDAAARAGVRRPFAPHQLRHAHAVEMSREGVPLLVIQRPLRPQIICVRAGGTGLHGFSSGAGPPAMPARANPRYAAFVLEWRTSNCLAMMPSHAGTDAPILSAVPYSQYKDC